MNHRFSQDEQLMRLAIRQASFAAQNGDIPVGAVLVRENEVVATGYNTRERDRTALGHAEMNAIDAACKRLGGWRLTGCTLYVTLEPCPMCAGAILNARIERVVFGMFDPKAGCFGSLLDLSKAQFTHSPRLRGGVLEAQCRRQWEEFFDILRQKEQPDWANRRI